VEALELFRAGKLKDAIASCTEQVKKYPNESAPRSMLGQLLCFAGQLDRADSHFKTLEIQRSDRKEAILLLRNLLAAAQARSKFYSDGWLPEFDENPPEHLKLHLQASIELREGNTEQAAQLLQQAEEQRPAVPGKCDGVEFTDFRDTDDLTSCFLEVLTSSGKYFWIPFERIRRLAFEPIESPINVLWRGARIDVQNGIQGVVYVPQLYEGSANSDDEEIQLGRTTEWSEAGDAPTRGHGHRILYIAGEFQPLAKLTEFVFPEAE